jgi:hypothetical protein
MGRVLRQARRASRRGCVDLGAAVIHMPREEIDFKDPRPSSRELGVEFVGRRLFGDDWIGKLSIADLKLLEQYGPKIEFRNGVEVRTINPCPERIRNRLDRAFGRGVVTRTAESVFFALLYLAEKYGRVFPSREGLAHLAMCCKQSAVTAIVDLERLGFVTRIRRIRQIKTPLGFTTRQITNAYRVHEPTRGLGLLAMAVFATGSNSWTASVSKFSSEESKDDFERMRRGVGPRNTAEGLSS